MKRTIYGVLCAAVCLVIFTSGCSSKPKTGTDVDSVNPDEQVQPDNEKELPKPDKDTAVEEQDDTVIAVDDTTVLKDDAADIDTVVPDEAPDGSDDTKEEPVDLEPDTADIEPADTLVIDENPDETADTFVPVDENSADETVLPDTAEQPDDTADTAVLPDPDIFDADTSSADSDVIVTCNDDGFACTEEQIINNVCVHIARHDQCGLGQLCGLTTGCRDTLDWVCDSCDMDAQDCPEKGDICAKVSVGSNTPVCMLPCVPGTNNCPEGFTCEEILNQKDEVLGFACTPDNNVCCMDLDKDSAGVGVECIVNDCNDKNASVHPGATEICNGIDDNCEKGIDESAALNAPLCTKQNGVCAGAKKLCGGVLGWVDCGVLQYTSISADYQEDETWCDYLDNDCDGTIDDPFTAELYKGCWSGTGVCLATGVNVCAANKLALECSAKPYSPTESPVETSCDGKDNNCDGKIDELFDRNEGCTENCKGDICFDGVGACRNAGVFACTDTGTACNAVANPPDPADLTPDGKEAVCDNIDNDCNGKTDDPWLRINGLCTSPAGCKNDTCEVGTGACHRAGILVCNPLGSSVMCNAIEGTPSAETCNNIDDNCNGQVDETYADKNKVCTVGTGICQRAGIYVCKTNGTGIECNVTAGQGTTETCNGKDDDCDGTIDNGYAINQPCSAGQGICRRSGVFICKTDGTGSECNAEAANVATGETCNGLDDNCDGTIDNGLTGTLCTNQTGVCAGTRQSCGGVNGWQTCDASEYAANSNGTYEQNETVCDGKDNDCDGQTDENVGSYAPLCELQQGVCKDSRKSCGGASGWQACSAGNYGAQYQAAENLCDYLDNDCDGTLDEGYKNTSTGKYDQNTACGNCETNCTAIYSKPNGFGTCDATNAPVCKLNCNNGYYSLNGIPDDGCEFELKSSIIYVSASEGDDNGDCGLGPRATVAGYYPCKSIIKGISQAKAKTRSQVYVADGLYEETVTLENGISLYGGFKADTWERHLSSTLTVLRGAATTFNPHKITIYASKITNTTVVEGFVVYGQAATQTGGNSYAFYIAESGTSLTFRNNTVYGAAGSPGSDGSAGSVGSNGGTGANGANAYETNGDPCGDNRAGTAGGTNASCTAANGGGGGGNRCVPSNMNRYSGLSGSVGSGTNGGAGGLSGYDGKIFSSGGTVCNDYELPGRMEGANGLNGGSGAEGAAGSGAGDTSGGIIDSDPSPTTKVFHWAGSNGGSGGNGVSGGGGGGGGAGGGGDDQGGGYDDVLGATGGSGGAGGCGATGANGGTSGGASLAFFISNGAAPVIENNTIYIGAGGNGGKGGNGGTGGAGGAGGNGGAGIFPCGGAGGKGGTGGRGGHGGGGGGGAGGVGYGIGMYLVTTTPPAYQSLNTFSGGQGGTGGTGGASLGNPGVSGSNGATAAVGDFSVPTGYIDNAGQNLINGWACDQDTSAINIDIHLHVYVGSTFITNIIYGPTDKDSEQPVQDICGNGSALHRWELNPSLNAQLKADLAAKGLASPQNISVYVFGLNTGSTEHGLLYGSPKTFTFTY